MTSQRRAAKNVSMNMPSEPPASGTGKRSPAAGSKEYPRERAQEGARGASVTRVVFHPLAEMRLTESARFYGARASGCGRSDDLVRLHLRTDAAVVRAGRRRGRAPLDRHRLDRRDVFPTGGREHQWRTRRGRLRSPATPPGSRSKRAEAVPDRRPEKASINTNIA